MILKEIPLPENHESLKHRSFPKRPFKTTISSLQNTCTSFWIENASFPHFASKHETTLISIATSPKKQLLKVVLKAGRLTITIRSNARSFVNFEVNLPLKKTFVHFIGLVCSSVDYRIFVNGKPELIVSGEIPPKTFEGREKKPKLYLVALNTHELQVSDFRLEALGEETVDFGEYYRATMLKMDEQKVSKEKFKENKTLFNFFTQTITNKTNSLHASGEQGSLGNTAEFKANGFDFDSFCIATRYALKNFEASENSFYPKQSSILEKKLIFKSLRSIFKAYEFLYSVVSLVSPPITPDNNCLSLNELKIHRVFRLDKFKRYLPTYPITFGCLKRILQKYFHLHEGALETLLSIIAHTPYLFKHLEGVEKEDSLKNVIFYDKSLLLLRKLFLRKEEENILLEQLMATRSYSFVDTNDFGERAMRQLACNMGIKMKPEIIYDTLFAKLPLESNFDELSSAVFNYAETFEDSIWQFRKNDEENVVMFTPESAKTSPEVFVGFGVKKKQHYDWPFKCSDITKISIKASVRAIYKIYFKVGKTKIKLISRDYDRTLKNDTKREKYVYRTTARLMSVVPIVSTRDNTILGFYMPLSDDGVLRISQDLNSGNNDMLDKSMTNQSHVFHVNCPNINPAPYNTSLIFNLPLRLDINCFTKQEYERYANTTSLIKFKVNDYIKTCKEFRDALENFLPRAIFSFNQFPIEKIGQFKIALKGEFHSGSQLVEEQVLFQNKEGERFPNLNAIYDNLCFAAIDHFPLDNLVQAQSRFFQARNLQIARVSNLDEEVVEKNNFIKTWRNFVHTESYECTNFGCSDTFKYSENTVRCNGHYGTWDFGHTGTNTQTAAQRDFKALWDPHWTCCGKAWDERCSHLHFHEHKSNRLKIDLEDPFNQKYFKKNIRANWMKQVKTVHALSENGIRNRIKKYAARINRKEDVKLLGAFNGSSAKVVRHDEPASSRDQQ
jgi:hypothetical protein